MLRPSLPRSNQSTQAMVIPHHTKPIVIRSKLSPLSFRAKRGICFLSQNEPVSVEEAVSEQQVD
jgi:hypothetical protein